MNIDGFLYHHRRGHWTLQWQDPQRNVWRVEHFDSEKKARDYARYTEGFYRWKISKHPHPRRYAQIGYWYGK